MIYEAWRRHRRAALEPAIGKVGGELTKVELAKGRVLEPMRRDRAGAVHVAGRRGWEQATVDTRIEQGVIDGPWMGRLWVGKRHRSRSRSSSSKCLVSDNTSR